MPFFIKTFCGCPLAGAVVAIGFFLAMEIPVIAFFRCPTDTLLDRMGLYSFQRYLCYLYAIVPLVFLSVGGGCLRNKTILMLWMGINLMFNVFMVSGSIYTLVRLDSTWNAYNNDIVRVNDVTFWGWSDLEMYAGKDDSKAKAAATKLLDVYSSLTIGFVIIYAIQEIAFFFVIWSFNHTLIVSSVKQINRKAMARIKPNRQPTWVRNQRTTFGLFGKSKKIKKKPKARPKAKGNVKKIKAAGKKKPVITKTKKPVVKNVKPVKKVTPAAPKSTLDPGGVDMAKFSIIGLTGFFNSNNEKKDQTPAPPKPRFKNSVKKTMYRTSWYKKPPESGYNPSNYTNWDAQKF